MNEEKYEKAEKAAGWLTGLITGWGVPGTVAKVIAGAIVGAVAAWYVATCTGCTVDYTRAPDGAVRVQSGFIHPVYVSTQKEAA